MVFILSIGLFSCSCCNDPNLERLKHGNGLISKIEYKNHSYIIWSLGGIVHDPDCKCLENTGSMIYRQILCNKTND
jgi:hypothetical protein